MKYIDGFVAIGFIILFCAELWLRNGQMAAMDFALALAYFRLGAESL